MPRPCDQAHQAQRFAAAERRIKAFELAKTGASYRAIGKALGVSRQQAYRDVVGELDRLNTLSLKGADDYRRLQLAQLEDLLNAIWPKAASGDIPAQVQALRIFERQSRLLGLDAPARVDIEQRVRIMAEQLGMDADELVDEATQILRATRS
jgi:Homeodomain-like domain